MRPIRYLRKQIAFNYYSTAKIISFKLLFLSVSLLFVSVNSFVVNFFLDEIMHEVNYKLKTCDVLMIGDSHTEKGNWNLLLCRLDVVEQAVGGDGISDIENSLNTALYRYKFRPKICLIQGGANTFYSYNNTDTAILAGYIKIIATLKKENIKPVVQSLFYHAEDSLPWFNKRVAVLSPKISKLCTDLGVDYIDVTTPLSTNKLMTDKYTYDDVHLNLFGYLIWSNILRKYLKNNKI